MIRTDTEVEKVEGDILITVTGEHGYVDGWMMVKEDLGLNKAGPDEIDGLEIENEEANYYDEEAQAHIQSCESVTLRFSDKETIDEARARLHEMAEERFRMGGSEAEKVRDFTDNLYFKEV